MKNNFKRNEMKLENEKVKTATPFNLKSYLDEILYQIKCAKESFNKAGGDDFANCHHFFIHCAIIHKILCQKKKISKKITQEQKEKQEEIKKIRKKAMKTYFNSYNNLFPDKTFIDIRNHLEHFDERLDRIITQRGNIIIDKNVSIGGPLPITGIPRNCFLRNKENGTYTILGDNFDTKKLWDFISKIEDYIKNNPC